MGIFRYEFAVDEREQFLKYWRNYEKNIVIYACGSDVIQHYYS